MDQQTDKPKEGWTNTTAQKSYRPINSNYRVVGMVFGGFDDALRVVQQESAKDDQTAVNAEIRFNQHFIDK